jgi:hypothetical protein
LVGYEYIAQLDPIFFHAASNPNKNDTLWIPTANGIRGMHGRVDVAHRTHASHYETEVTHGAAIVFPIVFHDFPRNPDMFE